MKRLVAAVIAFGLTAALSGCTTDNASASRDACTREAALSKYRSEDRPAESTSVSDVRVEQHAAGGAAYDVFGELTVKYAGGSKTRYRWACFSQTTGGKTYASVNSIDRVR